MCSVVAGAPVKGEPMSSDASRGLYQESYEKDSCGFGLIASLDDEPSNWLVKTAIS